MGLSVSINIGSKLYTFGRCYRRRRDLMANSFQTKQATENRREGLETRMDFLLSPEMSCTLVHKGLKIGSSFYPPSVMLSAASLPGFAKGDH